MSSGCGSGVERPPLGSVSGTVTYKEKPVTSGSVMFTPVGGSSGDAARIATGQLESDGTFTLTTFDTGDGAVLGQHVVTIEARGSMEQLKKMNLKADGSIAYKLPKPSVPEKYTKTDSSPLKFTVEKGKNSFKIELKD
jgi:hypothetical protein